MSIITPKLLFNFEKLITNLTDNFNFEGVYSFFEKLKLFKDKSFQEIIKEMFEKLDEEIFLKERNKNDLIVHSKVKRTIETIFGYVSFYRRYYYNKKTGKYVFLLDQKLDIDKYERIHKQVKLLVLENANGSMNYQDLIKTLYNANISVMSVSNILNKTNLAELSQFLTKMNVKKYNLKTTNVLYLQVDDTYVAVRKKTKNLKTLKSGKVVRRRNWKLIRVLTVHTGHVEGLHPKTAKKLENKCVFKFDTTNWSWSKALELCKNFYQVDDNTKYYVCGDGAKWIPVGAKELNGKSVMDTFHVIREYARVLNHKNNAEHDKLLKNAKDYFAAGNFNELQQLTLNLKKRDDLQHKTKKITKLIHYINTNKIGIESYQDANVIGCSIEGDIFNYIKRFLGKRKIFNEQAVHTLLTIKIATKNKINLLDYLKFEIKEQNLQKIQEAINLKWKYQTSVEVPITEGEFAGNKNRYHYKQYLRCLSYK